MHFNGNYLIQFFKFIRYRYFAASGSRLSLLFIYFSRKYKEAFVLIKICCSFISGISSNPMRVRLAAGRINPCK